MDEAEALEQAREEARDAALDLAEAVSAEWGSIKAALAKRSDCTLDEIEPEVQEFRRCRRAWSRASEALLRKARTLVEEQGEGR
jgi:hypothetical protein